jgi:hypothetical protein
MRAFGDQFLDLSIDGIDALAHFAQGFAGFIHVVRIASMEVQTSGRLWMLLQNSGRRKALSRAGRRSRP